MISYFKTLARPLDYRTDSNRYELLIFLLSTLTLWLFSFWLISGMSSRHGLYGFKFDRGGEDLAKAMVIFYLWAGYSFVSSLALVARRLNDLEWPKYIVIGCFIPVVNAGIVLLLCVMKGKQGQEEKLENLTRLLNEIHAFIVSQGHRQDLLLFPCPDYGKPVAEWAVMKIVDSGMYQASYSDGCFAIKAIPQQAAA